MVGRYLEDEYLYNLVIITIHVLSTFSCYVPKVELTVESQHSPNSPRGQPSSEVLLLSPT